jgi:hypothetical protein
MVGIMMVKHSATLKFSQIAGSSAAGGCLCFLHGWCIGVFHNHILIILFDLHNQKTAKPIIKKL